MACFQEKDNHPPPQNPALILKSGLSLFTSNYKPSPKLSTSRYQLSQHIPHAYWNHRQRRIHGVPLAAIVRILYSDFSILPFSLSRGSFPRIIERPWLQKAKANGKKWFTYAKKRDGLRQGCTGFHLCCHVPYTWWCVSRFFNWWHA